MERHLSFLCSVSTIDNWRRHSWPLYWRPRWIIHCAVAQGPRRPVLFCRWSLSDLRYMPPGPWHGTLRSIIRPWLARFDTWHLELTWQPCCLSCTVFQGWFRKTCINKELVSRGMAFVRPLRDSVEDAHPVIRRLESSLMDAEIKAEKWGRGAWATPSLWSRFLHRPKATAGRAFRDNLILSSVGRLWKEAHLRLNKKMSWVCYEAVEPSDCGFLINIWRCVLWLTWLFSFITSFNERLGLLV